VDCIDREIGLAGCSPSSPMTYENTGSQRLLLNPRGSRTAIAGLPEDRLYQSRGASVRISLVPRSP